jgi:hypothetical protein
MTFIDTQCGLRQTPVGQTIVFCGRGTLWVGCAAAVLALKKPTLQSAAAALLAILAILLAGCGSPASPPLWPGSKYTEADKSRAMLRALDYIDRSARDPKNFAAQASDYTYCFYSIAATASEPELRAAAARMAHVYAKRWAQMEAIVPAGATSDDVADMIFGWLPASLLGENDARIKPELKRAAARFTVIDYLQFDPAKEPPPSDIPADCTYDSAHNPRGATVCRKCGRPLKMRSKYDVWMDALIATYSGDRYGIPFGASYGQVLQWMPAMRPYLRLNETSRRNFLDTLYALTHVVYTLNDYGKYLLPRDLLPREFAYLKENLGEAIALHDPETMGEFLDTLKGFGLNGSDEVIRKGITYLLDTQGADGTWGDPKEKDTYTLYHSAWTAIDGLKDCRWQGEGLSFPQVRPLLDSMRDTKP